MTGRSTRSEPTSIGAIVIAVLAMGLVGGWWLWDRSRVGDRETLVVYCAHDAIYADSVLQEFERKTGIAVRVRYDTEATKSLSLLQLITAEATNPRCDVFWNNELLGAVELTRQGLLAPYQGSAWRDRPEAFRDPDGAWVAFGGRFRVWVWNPDRLSVSATSGQPAADSLSEVNAGPADGAAPELATAMSPFVDWALDPAIPKALAEPLYGTTLTHYALLWSSLGPTAVQDWDAQLSARGWSKVAGNAMVQKLVANGSCQLGWTDTDDVFVGRDAGARLEMQPVRIAGKTLCIPNTVMIIRGTQRQAAAERLVDFLASRETELMLARGPARQVPLVTDRKDEWPADVKGLADWVDAAADLRTLVDPRRGCLEWLLAKSRP